MKIDNNQLLSLLKINTGDLVAVLNHLFPRHSKDMWWFHSGGDTCNGRVCLVAHIDTVLPFPPAEIKQAGNILSSSSGIGADDRAGVYAAAHLWRSMPPAKRPALLLTNYEEVGGIGAMAAAEELPELSTVSYFIEIDRRGDSEAVYYNKEQKKFKKHIEKYGFYESIGTFSDIKILGREFGLCSVNVSAGFQNEHKKTETLDLKALKRTIAKLENLLNRHDGKQWLLKPEYKAGYYGGYAQEWYEKTGWGGKWESKKWWT